jgi:salicylate hydroxylase
MVWMSGGLTWPRCGTALRCLTVLGSRASHDACRFAQSIRGSLRLTTTSRSLRIAIAGAGISGLVAARALQRFGFRPRIYEQAAQLGEVGAGLTISPNATHVLNAIGLGPVLAAHGMQPAKGGVKDWRTGQLVVSIHRGDEMLQRYGAGYFQIHRADLHGALASAVEEADPGCIEAGRAIVDFDDAPTGVTLRFADGAAARADVLIGADGVRSTVRARLFGADRPRFTGYIAFRGLVPMSRLPPGIIEPTSCLSTGPDRSFTRYLIRGGTLVNFVGLAQRDGWREEGWSIASSREEMLAEYADWYPDVRTIISSTPDGALFKWALFDREPLPAWTSGRVTLLGDAAHPMLPFLGQGAAMGIEDGMVLARAFAAVSDAGEAFARYEAARRERTTWVMQKSRETGLAYHSGAPTSREPARHPSAESLGLMAYNPVAVPI